MAGIGFFAPLPLAMMMPFMAGQSMMMGDAFGKSYQYGKRKISAMSNEEFNKLTPKDLANDIQADFNAIIPSLGIAIKQSSQFQSLIIREMGEIIKSLPSEITRFFTGEEGGTGSSNDTALAVFTAVIKMLNSGGLPTQGNLGSGPSFIGAPQTNPFFPGGPLNPTPDTGHLTPPQYSPDIGPPVPPGGIKEPGKRPTIDPRLDSENKRLVSATKENLTRIANRVNTITSTYSPSPRRRTQSTNITLSNMIKSAASIRTAISKQVTRFQQEKKSGIRSALKKQIATEMQRYETISVNIAKHLKLYSI